MQAKLLPKQAQRSRVNDAGASQDACQTLAGCIGAGTAVALSPAEPAQSVVLCTSSPQISRAPVDNVYLKVQCHMARDTRNARGKVDVLFNMGERARTGDREEPYTSIV